VLICCNCSHLTHPVFMFITLSFLSLLHLCCILLPPVHPFNSLSSRTTYVSRHQKGKPCWILVEQEMMGWQWHQLNHMQIICTSLQTDNWYASTSALGFCRPPPSQQRQSTVLFNRPIFRSLACCRVTCYHVIIHDFILAALSLLMLFLRYSEIL